MTLWKLDADGRTPVTTEDVREWGKMLDSDARIVGKDTVAGQDVSTVFLGVDHSFGGSVPVLWETMIFSGPHNGYQLRYSSWEAAEAGHKRIVSALLAGQDPSA